jgi:hypothetical protein
LKETQALKVQRVQLQAQWVHKVTQAMPVLKEQMEILDHKEQTVHKVSLVHRVKLVMLVLKVRMEKKVHKVKLVLKVL